MSLKQDLVPNTQGITDVRLSLMSDQERLSYSFVEVNLNMTMTGANEIGGLRNPKMGKSRNISCKTCGGDKNCPGHFGHIKLNYPVYAPLFGAYVCKWLNVICHKCGAPFAGRIHSSSRIGLKAYRDANTKVSRCISHGCGAHVRKYTLERSRQYIINYVNENDHTVRLLPHAALDILRRVTSETLRMFGSSSKTNPIHAIWNIMLIPPNTLRPEVGSGEDGQQTNMINKALTSIIKLNETLISAKDNPNNSDTSKAIEKFNKEVFELVKGKTDVPDSKKKLQCSYISLLAGKEGYCREGGMSRRVGNLGRAVICCNPYIGPGSVGVPTYIAMNLCTPISVTPYNYNQMLMYYSNGSKTYPGCSKIQKKTTGYTFNVDKYKVLPESKLEFGDILFRHIIDGDYVVMHREPCIDVSTVTAMKVMIVPHGMSFFLNVVSCPLFDADFDGDQMSIQICIVACIPELKYLMSAESNLVSREDGIPKIGQHQDSIIYSCMLTRDHVQIMPQYLSAIFSGIQVGYNPTDTTMLGRDMVSMLFRKSNYVFSFKSSSKFCKSDLSKVIDFPDTEKNLVIERGVVKSGIIDGEVLPSKCAGGLNQRIKNLYGTGEAISFIGAYQRLCLNFGLNTLSSTSFRDVHIKKDTKQAIRNMISGVMASASEIIKDYYRGLVRPPVGVTTEEHVENLVKKLLYEIKNVDPKDKRASVAVCHDILKLYVENIDDRNQLICDIVSGAKGKKDNFLSMVCSVGLLSTDPRYGRYGGRSSIYSTKYSTDPREFGFVASSYCDGMDPIEEELTAAESRKAIVSRALTTAVAGKASRSTSKSLESVICDSLCRSMDGKNIVQMVYGGDGIDIANTTKVKVWLYGLDVSEEMIRDRVSDQVPSKCKKELEDHLSKIIELRRYVTRYMIARCRTFDVEWTDSISSCFNIGDHIESVQVDGPADEVTIQDIKDAALMLNRFSDDLPKIFYADEYFNGTDNKPHEVHRVAVTNSLAYVYSELNLSAVIKKKLNSKMLGLALELIKAKVLHSLMDAGIAAGLFTSISISHKFVQNIISSHHKLGGVSSTNYDPSRIEEISSVKVKSKIKSPSMFISLIEPHSLTEEAATLVANKIRCFTIKDFLVHRSGYCYGYIGSYTLPRDLKYNNLVIAHTSIHSPPSDISNKYVRVDLDLKKMVEKNIDINVMIRRLEKDNQYHVAFVAEKELVILFIHLCGKVNINIENTFQVMSFLEKIETLEISGVEGIVSFRVLKRYLFISNTDDACKVVKQDDYYIVTEGSNMYEILLLPEVGIEVTNNFLADEMIEFYGIAATARHHVNLYMGQLGKDIEPKHYQLVADLLSRQGKMIGIGHTGRSKRGDDDIKMITDEKVGKTLSIGPTVANKSDTTGSISSSIMMSRPIGVGTGSVDAKIDLEFIINNKPKDSINSIIDEIIKKYS